MLLAFYKLEILKFAKYPNFPEYRYLLLCIHHWFCSPPLPSIMKSWRTGWQQMATVLICTPVPSTRRGCLRWSASLTSLGMSALSLMNCWGHLCLFEPVSFVHICLVSSRITFTHAEGFICLNLVQSNIMLFHFTRVHVVGRNCSLY